jgi:hypothetical protein
MMNRARLNLVLLIVAAGLGLAVFFSQEKEEKGPPLTALTPDAVTRIAIEHPGSDAIRLEKKDGRWLLTAPVRAVVDEFEINALVGLADRETREKLEGANLAELGLDPPQYTITLNDTAIAFGSVEPLQYRRYVKTGEAVYLVEDPPSAALDKDYADLVSKNLFAGGAEIQRIDLPKLSLLKDADGKWQAEPANPKATADAMQKLADGWKTARSMWNEQSKAAKPKGDRVRITLKGGETAQFVVVEREPQLKLYRAETGVNYVLSKALTEELLKLPEPKAEEPKAQSAEQPAAAGQE